MAINISPEEFSPQYRQFKRVQELTDRFNRGDLDYLPKRDLNKVDITNPTKNGKSFFSQELTKLRKSIGKKGMKQFYQVAFDNSRKERMKNETQ